MSSPCKDFLDSRCALQDMCPMLHEHCSSHIIEFSFLFSSGDDKPVKGIARPRGSNILYTVTEDGTLRHFCCDTQQCIHAENVGGQGASDQGAGCMTSDGPWLFIGITGAVEVVNTNTGVKMKLAGPNGKVCALTIANDELFAGVQDGKIVVWKFNNATNRFLPEVSLSGHRLPVISLVAGSTKLFSASKDKTIKVWDLTTKKCIQTLSEHTDVVTSVLLWNDLLFSCSLDQTIKVWEDKGSTNFEVIYTHRLENASLSLSYMKDASSSFVLLC